MSDKVKPLKFSAAGKIINPEGLIVLIINPKGLIVLLSHPFLPSLQ